ncbi:TrbC/VirB2 family protein [Candidatus Saccharibacteria bacterium]|nr:TrbC/VirB2 family protein [Candidatus Saccharibacteria bacterium]
MALPAMVHATSHDPADIRTNLCAGANLDVNNKTCAAETDTTVGDKANSLIAKVINIFSLVVGVVAVIMIIVAGFRYITSGGDSNNVTSAKNTILYAIIGLIIVALAQFIVKFVLERATVA